MSDIMDLAVPKDDGKIFWQDQKRREREVWGPKRFEEENNNK